MSAPVSVIMPAYSAEATIGGAVKSVLAQTHQEFELVIAADDLTDYRGVLAEAGIEDKRIVHVATGGIATGSSRARNVAIGVARYPYLAELDADDRFAPDKLARGMAALARHPLVTTGLKVVRPDGRMLRTVGCTGRTELLSATYKRVNLSMDSMLLWDREKVPILYDTTLPCLIDLDFIIRAFAYVEASLHIGEALHTYVKQPGSMSNAPGSSPVYAATKRRLIAGLEGSEYSLRSPGARQGFLDFLRISLRAESRFEAALASNPELIFEDHLEPMLATG